MDGVDRRGGQSRSSTGSGRRNIQELGSDVLVLIFSRLQPVALACCSVVCMSWRDMINLSLWRSVCLRSTPRLNDALETDLATSHTPAGVGAGYRIRYAAQEQMDRLRHGPLSFQKWKAHAGRVNSCKMMMGEVVSCSADKTVRVWNANTLSCTEEYKVGGKDPIIQVYFDETKVIGALRRNVLLWSRRGSKRLVRRMGCDSDICSMCVADADIAVGCADGTVRVYDLYSGRLVKIFRMHAEPVKAVVIDPINKTMASGSNDGTVKLFDAHSGQKVASLLRPPSLTGITCMQQSVTDHKLFSGSKGGDTYCFDLREKRPLWKKRNLTGAMTCMHIPTYLSSALAVGGVDGTINVSETDSAESIAMLKTRSPHFGSPILGIALGMTKLVTCHADSTMIMWKFGEVQSDSDRSKNSNGRRATLTFRNG